MKLGTLLAPKHRRAHKQSNKTASFNSSMFSFVYENRRLAGCNGAVEFTVNRTAKDVWL